MPLPIYYTTIEQVYRMLPVVGSLTSVTTTQIAQYIGGADAIINSKLARTYTVPISPAPPILEALSTDLTLYYLLAKRVAATAPSMGGSNAGRNEWFDRYKEAMALLDKIAMGEMLLLTSSGELINPAPSGADVGGSAWSNNQGFSQTFANDAYIYEIYEVDGLKISDS